MTEEQYTDKFSNMNKDEYLEELIRRAVFEDTIVQAAKDYFNITEGTIYSSDSDPDLEYVNTVDMSEDTCLVSVMVISGEDYEYESAEILELPTEYLWDPDACIEGYHKRRLEACAKNQEALRVKRESDAIARKEARQDIFFDILNEYPELKDMIS